MSTRKRPWPQGAEAARKETGERAEDAQELLTEASRTIQGYRKATSKIHRLLREAHQAARKRDNPHLIELLLSQMIDVLPDTQACADLELNVAYARENLQAIKALMIAAKIGD